MNVLSKSVTGEELCQQLITTLAVQLSVAPSNLLATMRDGAAVNGAAVRLLKASIYTECQDIICFSHTFDNTGKKFDTPDLDDFFHLWSSLFLHSCAARLRWKALTGLTMKTYSPTRWWSRWEVLKQTLKYFGDVEPFLEENADVGARLRDRLLVIFNDNERKKRLMV